MEADLMCTCQYTCSCQPKPETLPVDTKVRVTLTSDMEAVGWLTRPFNQPDDDMFLGAKNATYSKFLIKRSERASYQILERPKPEDTFPDGTVLARYMTPDALPFLYIKRGGKWVLSGGQPIPWSELLERSGELTVYESGKPVWR